MTDETPAPRLFVRNKYNNTVLNWHREPEKEFHLYGAKAVLVSDRHVVFHDGLQIREGPR